jgi:hypothetical protein
LFVTEGIPEMRDLPEAGKTDETSKADSVGRKQIHAIDPSSWVHDPICKFM